jgi:hypothetical protein
MNKRSSNGASSETIISIVNMPEITNDLETEEMCCEKLKLLSKVTHKLRAEVTGERTTPSGK